MSVCRTLGAWLLGTILAGSAAAQSAGDSALALAVTEVERIDAMRSSLAKAFATGGPIDRETLAQVCRPVGAEVRRVAEAHGWMVARLAEQFRNPSHRPDAGALEAIRLLEANSDLRGGVLSHRSSRSDSCAAPLT